ncbi:MAG: TIGR04086 family membrane protein [Clostridia bacterium]|nr:TIGR04086 family membrane protein [Clostridia bacterium]
MRSRQQESSATYRVLRPLLWGVLVGVVSCLLVLLMMAAVLAAGDIARSAITPLAVAAAVFAALVGGFLTARLRGEKGWLFGAACGLILYVLVMLTGLIMTQQLKGGYAFLKLVLMVLAGAVGGVLGVNRRRR